MMSYVYLELLQFSHTEKKMIVVMDVGVHLVYRNIQH